VARRALGARGETPDGRPAGLTARSSDRSAGTVMPALARRNVHPQLAGLLGSSDTPRRGALPRRRPGVRSKNRRDQDIACSTPSGRSRCGAGCCGRPDVHRRRFCSYDRLIRDEHGSATPARSAKPSRPPPPRRAGADTGTQRVQAILAPTLPLSRHIFQAPTYSYRQASCSSPTERPPAAFRMAAASESARSVVHLAEL